MTIIEFLLGAAGLFVLVLIQTRMSAIHESVENIERAVAMSTQAEDQRAAAVESLQKHMEAAAAKKSKTK